MERAEILENQEGRGGLVGGHKLVSVTRCDRSNESKNPVSSTPLINLVDRYQGANPPGGGARGIKHGQKWQRLHKENHLTW